MLDWAYRGEVLFSRIQGIAFDRPGLNGEYQLIRALRTVVKVAVDAGANRGDWTARLLAEIGARARVACIEPDPENAALLRKRFGCCTNVAVYEAAISDTQSTCGFWSEGVEGSGAGHLVSSGERSSIQVALLTLEAICREQGYQALDLVKCDIEGEEMRALLGAESLFRSSLIGTMQVEYNSTWLRTGYRAKDLFEFAADYGYTLLAATPLGFTRYPTYGEGLEDFRMRHFILVREDHLRTLKALGPAGRARVESTRMPAAALDQRKHSSTELSSTPGLYGPVTEGRTLSAENQCSAPKSNRSLSRQTLRGNS